MKWLLYVLGLTFSIPASGQADADSSRIRSEKHQYLSDSIQQHDTLQYLEVFRIIIIGNERTRENIIRRELSIKKGDVLYAADLPAILEKDKRRVFNLRLFNTVDFRTLPAGENKIDLIIEVNERWYTFPIPRFELSDRNLNEWWENYDHDLNRVTYGLKLYQYNVRGRNETLLFTALFGFQKKFQLTYRIPYIDKNQKHGLILDMDFIDAKNLAYRTVDHKLEFLKHNRLLRNTRGIALTYTFRNSFYEQHRFSYGYRDTEIADTIKVLNPNYLGDENRSQRFDAIAYEFISDRRDVVAYPLKGHHLVLHAQQNGVALHNDLKKSEVWLSFAKFLELRKNFFLSNYTFGYISDPARLAYFNYGAMGYNYTYIRGYEVYVIESPKYFLNKTTFKKKIFSTQFRWEQWPIEQFRHIQLAIYLKSFADFGYASNYPNYELNTGLADKFLGSAGFGLDIVSSYDVVIRCEYTFTVDKTQGFFLHLKKEF